jgi:hypothetical protein
MNNTPKQQIEDGAASALKKSNPKLFDLINTGIKRDKLTPAKIDKYIHIRFGLKKGHPVRDMCYLAALSIQRTSKVQS